MFGKVQVALFVAGAVFGEIQEHLIFASLTLNSIYIYVYIYILTNIYIYLYIFVSIQI